MEVASVPFAAAAEPRERGLVPSERTNRNGREKCCHAKRVFVDRDLPAGIHSTKDALDDGNAYDSALRAVGGHSKQGDRSIVNILLRYPAHPQKAHAAIDRVNTEFPVTRRSPCGSMSQLKFERCLRSSRVLVIERLRRFVHPLELDHERAAPWSARECLQV